MFGLYLMVIWWKGLRWAEGLSGGRVQRRPSRRVSVWVGKGRCHREQDSPDAGLHERADLEQLQANRATGRVGEARVDQADAPERAHQHVGERSEPEAQLIGAHRVRGCPVGEQVELTFLDAVLHLA